MKKICLALAVLMILLSFTACDTSDAKNEIVNLNDIDGKRIGILVGTLFEDTAKDDFPHATLSFYNTYSDLIKALSSDKIDTFLCDDATAEALCDQSDDIEYIPQLITKEKYSPIFTRNEKGKKLCEQFNEFLYEYSESGKLSLLQGKWIKAGTEARLTYYDYEDLPDINGVIKIAATADSEPFSFLSYGRITGYEIGLVYEFCKEYGYKPDLVSLALDDVFSDASVGRIDMGVGLLSYTDERNEKFLFSSPDYEGGAVAVIKADNTDDYDFLAAVKNGFDKTFVREGRWQMFLKGIGVTLLISISAALFGTILGFGLYSLEFHVMGKTKVVRKLLDIYVLLLKRIPIVVFLMIVYYVVFGNTSVSGLNVSIIAFTAAFSATIVDLFHMAIDRMGLGQHAAALSLGYSQMEAYKKFILPQAARNFANEYKESIISLVQATAVVGYITVEDLTKISDLIRSRSYETVFPLVSTAIIYLLLAWGIMAFIKSIEVGNDPRRRTPEKILKGVDKQ